MRRTNLAACLLVLATFACGLNPSMEGAADVSEEALAAYRVEMNTSPSQVAAGTTPRLAIRVLGANGQVVTQFDDLHTQPMHLVAVSSDLQDFLHVHPVLAPNGTLSVDAPIGRAQPYKMFFEYDPKGPAGEQTSRTTLQPVGATSVAPALSTATAFAGGTATSTLVGSTRVALQPLAHPMIMAGTPTTLKVAVTTASGAPVTDLVDWLGMPGHAIVLSEDASTFIHAHGMRPGGGGHGGHGGHGGGGDAGSPTGNVLEVAVDFPQAGLYKMFVQVKRANDVITAPFVLKVVPSHGPQPPQPSCATITCPSGQTCMVMGSPPAPMCM